MIILFLVYTNIVLGCMLLESKVETQICMQDFKEVYHYTVSNTLDLQVCRAKLKKENESEK